jgi:carboxyl-terminal processing protease
MCAVAPVRAVSPAELLEKGIYTEETKGELKTATEIYQQIADDPAATRSLVAQAQLRLGLCQLKLGNKPQAISALERLTQEFPDKDKLLSIVDQHMPQLLDEMVQQIGRNYIQEVDRSELMQTALRAIVGKLDATGGVLRPTDMEFLGTNDLSEMNVMMDQQLAGIGAALGVDKETGAIVVTKPLPNSPAQRAGVLPDDRIVAIDRAPLPADAKLASVVQTLRGPVGTAVTLGVKRGGLEEVREIQIVRDTIKLPSVLGDHRRPDNTWDFMMDDTRKIGYVRLTAVGKQSAQEMETALKDLTTRGMKALILDLRSNPGGMLDGAVAVADLFVDSGKIVTIKGRRGESVHEAKAEGTFLGFPIVVLVNRKTSSAAEIVAACLQDHRRAVVVGERTFGQGIVRSIVPLTSGSGALKLPVAAYYRPNGKNVNRFPDSKDSDDWGVTPDEGYAVTMTEDEIKRYETNRVAREGLSAAEPPPIDSGDRALQKALEALAQLK